MTWPMVEWTPKNHIRWKLKENFFFWKYIIMKQQYEVLSVQFCDESKPVFSENFYHFPKV